MLTTLICELLLGWLNGFWIFWKVRSWALPAITLLLLWVGTPSCPHHCVPGPETWGVCVCVWVHVYVHACAWRKKDQLLRCLWCALPVQASWVPTPAPAFPSSVLLGKPWFHYQRNATKSIHLNLPLGWEDPLEEGLVTHSSILGQRSLVGYSP